MMTLILASMDTNNKGNGVIKSERVEENAKANIRGEWFRYI